MSRRGGDELTGDDMIDDEVTHGDKVWTQW